MDRMAVDRHKLYFGPYRTPQFRYGQRVGCLARGQVQIVKLSAARIPWPVGRTKRAESLVLYRDLARAVRRESSKAVAYWWGVTGQTVTKWRRALGVTSRNEGDRRLIGSHSKANGNAKFMHAKHRDPVRRAKIAAAHRGRKRPAEVMEPARQWHLGRKLPAAHRRKLSEAHKRRGTRPPWLNAAWQEWEDELCRTLPAAEVAKRTGRTLYAVQCRRNLLGIPDGRTKAERRKAGR